LYRNYPDHQLPRTDALVRCVFHPPLPRWVLRSQWRAQQDRSQELHSQ
jgi:hypothetical protein